jgi:hypothetical protein
VTAQKGKEQNEKEILDKFDKLIQEQNNAEQKKLAPAKPEEKQRGKSVDPKTTTENQRSPKEELGKEPLADIALPKLPQATRAPQPTKTPETLFSLVILGFVILFLSAGRLIATFFSAVFSAIVARRTPTESAMRVRCAWIMKKPKRRSVKRRNAKRE